jgi:hypothetical protein
MPVAICDRESTGRSWESFTDFDAMPVRGGAADFYPYILQHFLVHVSQKSRISSFLHYLVEHIEDYHRKQNLEKKTRFN